MSTAQTTKRLETFEQALEKGFGFLEKHPAYALLFFFLLGVAVRLVLVPYRLVFRDDAYAYLLKGLEIARGDFAPIRTHAIGWPLFMAPFLYFFGSPSIFQNMVVARVIAGVVGALSIFPLFYIGRRVLDGKGLIFLLTVFAFSFPLWRSVLMVYAEPLFVLLLLLCVLFILKARENRNYILLASLMGAFSYYVRPNGLFVLLIILLSFFLLRNEIPKFTHAYAIPIVLIFFAVSSPFLYQRYQYFGSAADYGANSKFFVDSHEQIWSENVPVPSLMEYLKTHGISDWADKFIVHGLGRALYHYTVETISSDAVSALLVPFFFYGIIRFFRDKRFIPVLTVIAVWTLSLIPVHHIHRSPRQVFAAIPFMLVLATAAVCDVLRRVKYRNVILCSYLAVFTLVSLAFMMQRVPRYAQGRDNDGIEWGKWAAENIRGGKIAVYEGGDLIMMHLPDATVGGVHQFTLYAPESGLSIVRPGDFEDLDSAMRWFREIGVTHLVFDPAELEHRPYLKALAVAGNVPSYLREVYSNYNTSSRWKVIIYAIDWAEYDRTLGKTQ